MKYVQRIPLALVILAVLLPPTVSAFTCQVMDSGSCSGANQEIIFRLSSDDNAHGGTATGSSYGRVVCCEDSYTDVGSDCSAPITESALRLSAPDNAHAETPIGASGFSNPVDVCLSADAGEPYCILADSNGPSFDGCPDSTECLATLSSLGNAHLGDCRAPTYQYWLCCRVNRRPNIDDIYPTQWPPQVVTLRGDIGFNVSASDPDDNDDIDQVRYVITDSIDSLIHSELLCSASGTGCTVVTPGMEWNHTWSSFPQISGQENSMDVGAIARAGGEWSDWRNETFNIDNTPPDAWITDPPDLPSLVGRRFNVTWDNNTYAASFELQYSDRARFQSGIDWENTVTTGNQYYELDLSGVDLGANPQYCYRIYASDAGGLIPDSWSCDPLPGDDPAASNCNCTQVDSSLPDIREINSTPMYTPSDSFDVNWVGEDAEVGVKCYQVEYMIINNRSTNFDLIQDWTRWSSINDPGQVLVLDESSGTCQYESCVSSLTEIFTVSPFNDNRTYYFRARAIDDIQYGCANVGDWSEAPEGTWIDNTEPPYVTASVEDNEGNAVNPPDGFVKANTIVTFNVASDVSEQDYSGVNETGIIYQLLRIGLGYPIGNLVPISCPDSTTCNPTESWDGEYNVTYRGYSVDKAGNRNETETSSFMVLKPFSISSTSNNIHMILGSYDIIPITVANRQDEPEPVKIKMMDDYRFARFVDVSEGVLSDGNRTLDLTLQAMQTKTFHALIYTADVGNYEMTINANSTREGNETKISDTLVIDLKVVFPEEFSGMSYASVAALTAIAAALYFMVERRKR